MATEPLFSANHYQKLSFGDFGFRLLDDNGTTTTPVGEKIGVIHVLKNSTFSASSNTSGGDSDLTNLALDEGHTIVGNFSNITLTHGTIICYIRK
ncbi:hypothetical protein OAA02_00590 [bacterium]|nr:hypothetical protein [bacterium]